MSERLTEDEFHRRWTAFDERIEQGIADPVQFRADVRALIAQAVRDEREACAQSCDYVGAMSIWTKSEADIVRTCARRIRARDAG